MQLLPRAFFFLGLLILPGMLAAVNLEPWYPPLFEIQPFVSGLSQHSSSVESPHGNFEHGLHANFLNCGASISYFEWAGELDLSLAETSKRTFSFDHLSFTARYQIADDVALVDPLSVVASLTVNTASRTALTDIATFHHGRCEAIAHLSLGKEIPSGQFWFSRLWGALGMGMADKGSPWWHFHLCAEKNVFDRQRWMIFMDSLIGCGVNSLARHKSFHGYGSIAHRSVDLGVNYRYSFECGLQAFFGYSYRIYAQNFPQHTNSFLISILYPLGVGAL